MTTSTLMVTPSYRRTASTGLPGCRASHARIAAALGRYAESQSGYAILPEPARHVVLEIGDRLHGLREALRSAEPGWGAGPEADGMSESLVASALRDAVNPCLDRLTCEIGLAGPIAWHAASRYLHDRHALSQREPRRHAVRPLAEPGPSRQRRRARGSPPGALPRRQDHGRCPPYCTAPARILSVAAGPAMELQLILREDPSLLAAESAEITLLDQDASALTHASEQINALAARAGVEVTLSCVNTSIMSVIAGGLHGSYDLIYSAGLFDYLKDSTASAAGVRLVEALNPGGRAVIGNFGIANPTRPLMELMLDWPLHHRSASDLRRLFGDIGTSMAVEQEATGINLFAVISA